MGLLDIFKGKFVDPTYPSVHMGGDVITTSLGALVKWGRKSSIWPMPFGTACCAIEFMALSASHYDIARFGAEVLRFSPRQADLMLVAGTIVEKEAPVLKTIYDQMPEPKWVISMGVCACSGGFYRSYHTMQGIDEIIPVDVYVPGCPPSPEGLIAAVMKIQERILKGEQAKEAQGAHRLGANGEGANDRRARRQAWARDDQGRLEQGQPRLGSFCRLAVVDEADAINAPHEVAPDRQWRGLQRKPERSVDGSRMAEVVAHEALDALTRRAAGVAEPLRDPLLHFVAEDVVVAPGLEVQHRPDAQQELLRVLERARAGAAVREQRRVRELGDRLRPEQIAKSARRFLHVGLELVERVVVLAVALGNEPLERFERARVRPRDIRGRLELVQQGRIADDGPGIRECEQELRIVGFEPRAFRHLANVVPDRQA